VSGNPAAPRLVAEQSVAKGAKLQEKARKSGGSGESVDAGATHAVGNSGSQWLENSCHWACRVALLVIVFHSPGEKLQTSFSNSTFFLISLVPPLPSSFSSCFFESTATHNLASPSQCWPFELSPALSTGRPCVQLPALLRRGPST
jgi:hypothetical protein